MELDYSLDEVRAHGLNVITISPDSVENLRAFSEARGIRFPMLSDPGGAQAIERFDVLNRNFDDTPPDFVVFPRRGIPFPGHFLLDGEGRILDKAFTGDLRHRPSGTMLVLKNFGLSLGGNGVEVRTGEFVARVVLSSDSVFGGQELGLIVDFTVAAGWHIYGSPLPDRYTPLRVVFEDTFLADQTVVLPDAKPMRFEAMNEVLPAYDGSFRADGRVRVKWNPVISVLEGVKEFESLRLPIGDQVLRGRIEYQACDHQTCLMPRSVEFELPLRIEPDLSYAIPDR